MNQRRPAGITILAVLYCDFSGALLQMAVAVAPNVWIVWYMFQPHVKQSFLTAGRARSEGAGGGRSEARSET